MWVVQMLCSTVRDINIMCGKASIGWTKMPSCRLVFIYQKGMEI